MARKKKPEEHSHSESWLVSYCDMISLLVTFFLMMMTFSTKDTADVREVGVGLLKGRRHLELERLHAAARGHRPADGRRHRARRGGALRAAEGRRALERAR